MPKSKNGTVDGRRSKNKAADWNVTVYNYAHATGGSDRERKGDRNTHNCVAGEVAIIPHGVTEVESLDWDEKTLESLEAEIDSLIIGQSSKKSDRKSELPPVFHVWADYPLDLWFLISRFVNPEDVGRFAGICQATHFVTHTAHFWVQLYHRMHSKSSTTSDLPSELQPYSLERIHGLRARVIRSAHHIHPGFSPEPKFVQFPEKLYKLEGRKCVSSWYKKSGRNWHLFFKLKKPEWTCSLSQYSDEITSYEGYHLLKGFCDLHHNKSEGCSILSVRSTVYNSNLSSAMGLYLISIGVSVSRCMAHHKLKLVFDSRHYVRTPNADSQIVCIDPAIHAKLHDWWQPGYNNT